MTSTALARAGSGKSATGCNTQSELDPSACFVELPSKFQTGSCPRLGSPASSTIFVLLRRFGVGSYPSSQMYSALNFAIDGAPLLRLDQQKRPHHSCEW